MSTEKQEFDINADIRIAKEWSQPEHLPPGHIPGEGYGWRHTCYRLAKHIELQNDIIQNQLGLRKTITDELDQIKSVMKLMPDMDRAKFGIPDREPETPKIQVSQKDLYNVYIRGFREAMECKSMKTPEDEAPEVQRAYEEGHKEGWLTRQSMTKKASLFTKHFPRPISNQS